MSTVGTSVVIACSALIAALQADSVLSAAGVNISYDAPVVPEDLKSTDGDYEAIWIGDADETEDIPVLSAGHLHRDETIAQAVGVSPSKAGGRPRPSLKWQPAQERALNSGPSPSRAVVEAGAVTQFWLKKELPTKKSNPCWRGRPGTGRLKASGVVSKTVAAPPASSSPASR